jgi:hypothetical protein
MTVSTRAATVLSRFPRHLGLDAPGTLFGDVVDGLAGHLDRMLSDLGRVRRAHRLMQAEERSDLLLLAALHAMRADLLEPVRLRVAAALARAAGLRGDATAQAAALAGLPDALALAPEAWPAAPGESAAAALARMAAAIDALGFNAALVDAQRRVVVDLIAVHREGNGSCGALLRGAAALLSLQPGRLRRSSDDFWHLLDATERLRPEGAPAPRGDLLALEENPEEDVDIEPVPRRHCDLFTVDRLGFGPVPCDTIVVAREDRCIWPMVVDVGLGHAVVYAGRLDDGQALRWRSSGIVELDGADVSNLAFSIDGGVFADEAAAVPGIDFVFADEAAAAAFGDRAARFGVCKPVATALDAPLPHAGGLTPPITLRVGTTRLRFFVREAVFAAEGQDTQPVFAAGFWDGSLAADSADQPAANVGFAWRERQPYTCTLWLPRRFSVLDVDGETPLRERIRLALDRLRPAGVYLGVDYADDLWTLGQGVLRDIDSTEPEGLIIHGTRVALSAPANL